MIFDKDNLNKFYRYCYSLTANEQSAYDLLQTSLEKYLKQKDQSKHSSLINNKEGYLRTIIRNSFIDQYRKDVRQATENYDEDITQTDISIDTLENLIINQDQISQIWNILQPIEREILFMWAIEGYSAKEIAMHLDMPKNTVLSRIFRIRIKIKEQYHPTEEVNNA